VENFGLSNGRSVNIALPPTTAQQYEVGLKAAVFGGRVTATLAWFDLTKQNIATPDPDPARAAAGFQVVTGEARNRGIELDIAGELWPGVNAIATYAYIDSKITKDRGQDFANLDVNGNPAITSGNTGHRFFGVPRNGGSFWLTYEPQAPAARGLKIGAGVVARSQQEGNNENTFKLPGYALVNMMAGYSWRIGPSKMSLQLNVDNLLNAVYFDPQGGGPYAQFGAPRMFLGMMKIEL
jgi:iron complex outermembrane receptor protein